MHFYLVSLDRLFTCSLFLHDIQEP
jgi:hypothetical protein